MATPKITIHDCLTGETITRDFNAAELAQLEADKVAYDARALAHADALAAKQVARAALLTKLGITEQEAQLLLGS